MTLKLKATLPWHLIVIIAAGALATISAGRYVPGLPQLILGPSKALASSCAVFRQSAELFHDFTIIPTPKASTDEGPEKIARRVWHRFISHLDPDKTYFTAADIHALHDLLKDESISPTHQGVCKAIELVGDQFTLRVTEAQTMVLGLIDELHNLSYTIHQPTTMVVDPDFYDHPSGPEELIERWRKRLILRSLQLSEFPPSTTRDLLTEGALAAFAPMKTPQFFYLRFIEAYLATFDPHAYISTEHNKSIAAFHTIRGEKYISHPNKSSWLIPYLHLLLKQWHLDFIPTVWFPQKTIPFGFPNYYFINTGDVVLSYFLQKSPVQDAYSNSLMKETKPDTPRYSPTKYHYLRRTYRGYQWHQLTSSIHPHRFSRAPYGAQAAYPIQILPRDLVTQRRDGAAETFRSPSSKTTFGHLGYSTVGYLSLASFSYLQKILREKGRQGVAHRVSEALSYLATSSRSPVTTLVIDMRSADLYQMDIMLELLAPFLPNTLAARVISSGHNKEFRYATPSPEYHYTGAVIILVNDETKRHAELFAATLQERDRALIIGEGLGRATAGKGIQNRILSLPENIAMPEKFSHRLFLSYSYLYTPGGRVIEGRGVTPDISLPLAVDLPVPNSTPERIRRFYQDNPIPKPLANNFFNDIQCFVPRTPSRTKLIHRLRDRAYERMLARTYPQLKLSPRGDSDQELEVIEASFEETFSLSAVGLREQSPPPCLHTMCGKVGLLKKDYLRHQQINDYRAQRLEATEDLRRGSVTRLRHFAQEDPALWETLHIALDYKAHHERLLYSQKHFSLQAPLVK